MIRPEMLPSPTIRKFFRESFNSSERIVIEKKADRIEWLDPVRKRLDRIPRAQCHFQLGYDHHKTQTRADSLKLIIASPQQDDQETFVLHFGKRNGIDPYFQIESSNWQAKLENAAIGDVSEIESLVEKIVARQDRTQLRKRKSAKIASIKEKGMKAKLRELAATHGFSFAIGHTKKSVNLSLRLSEKQNEFHVSFPKSKFDEVIEHLPQMVSEFKKLGELEVSFRARNQKSSETQSEWILPAGEDVESSEL